MGRLKRDDDTRMHPLINTNKLKNTQKSVVLLLCSLTAASLLDCCFTPWLLLRSPTTTTLKQQHETQVKKTFSGTWCYKMKHFFKIFSKNKKQKKDSAVCRRVPPPPPLRLIPARLWSCRAAALFTFKVVKAGEAASETLLRLPWTFHHEMSCKQKQWKEICSFQNERLKERSAEKLSFEYQTHL